MIGRTKKWNVKLWNTKFWNVKLWNVQWFKRLMRRRIWLCLPIHWYHIRFAHYNNCHFIFVLFSLTLNILLDHLSFDKLPLHSYESQLNGTHILRTHWRSATVQLCQLWYCFDQQTWINQYQIHWSNWKSISL